MANDDITEHADDFPEDSDPAAAFNALQRAVEKNSNDLNAELTVIRKGLEAAFEQFDTYQQPVDYRADIVRLADVIEGLAETHIQFSNLPLLKHGPEHYARVMERHGESLVQTASNALEQRCRELEHAALDIAAYAGSARLRKKQNVYLWLMGLGGFVAGVVAIEFLPYAMIYVEQLLGR